MRSLRSARFAVAAGIAMTVASTMMACVGADVGATEGAIVNGTLEPGHPEVVYMYRLDGAACTGSIISPRVVLTANHCVEGSGGTPAPASYFRIYVGSSNRQLTAEYRVTDVRPVPNAGIGREANDLALLVLATAATETPIELGRGSPSVALFGSEVTAIGFGQTPSGGSGTKYTTMMGVDGFQAGYIYVTPSVCSGDSGGPLIGPDGLVYGVASFIYSADGMTAPSCGTAPGAYNEIFRHLDFIDQVLVETGSCIAQPEETCNGADDDCDDAVDEGCTPLGEPCVDDSTCVGGLCGDTTIGRVCTSRCDPLRPAEGCGLGSYCSVAVGCDGFCVPGALGTGMNDEDCTADTDCDSLYCADPGDGRRRCLDPCRGDAGLCLADEVCAAVPGACGGCVPREIVRAGRGLGEPCDLDDECRGDMVCFDNAGAMECARACIEEDEECGEGFECRSLEATETSPARTLCIRDRRQGIGGSCVSNLDCGDGVCARQGERSWCTAPCDAAADCPTGFDCIPAGTANVCAPVGGLLGEACVADAECVTGMCRDPDSAEADMPAPICTSFCDSRTACAAGFECTRDEDASGGVCSPAASAVEVDGGCSVSAVRTSASAPWLVGFGALVIGCTLRRRRR